MFLRFYILFISLIGAVLPFHLTQQRHAFVGIPRRQQRPWPSASFMSSRDEEIARLEQQIRQLREETLITPKDNEEIEEKVPAKEKVVLEVVPGKDMLLTEGVLIQERLMEAADEVSDNSGMGNLVFTILGAVAVAAFLFVFAQAPIGQEDLSKYSATGSAGITTIDLGDLNPDRKSSTGL